jgi:hypothetical protein
MNSKQWIQGVIIILALFAFLLGWMKFYQVGFFNSNAAPEDDIFNYPLPDVRNSPTPLP